MTEALAHRFAGHMGRLLGPDFPSRIALAVSGGGDSMAMLALSHAWARVYGVGLHVVTVDHGLRADSCEEATAVAEECATLGHPHTTLTWQWDGTGNLQGAARQARQRLIGQWRGDIAHVLFAHTQDDQAETLLMRLLRGSGVEGLSAIPEARDMGGWHIIRPLLSESRADLRHHADVLKLPYVDDPSNDNAAFQRVRIRQAIKALDLDTTALAQTATRMTRARDALAARAADIAVRCISEDRQAGAVTGDLVIDRDFFAPVEQDTQLRLLSAALCWVSSNPYRPRARPLEELLTRALSGGGGSLHGAQILVTPRHMRICREYAAVRDAALLGNVWDSRWQISALSGSIRALGPDGWQQLPPAARTPAPHDAVISRPALFDGDRLLACAATLPAPQFDAILRPKQESFVASLLSR